MGESRFHTTMVLTQHESQDKLTDEFQSFHTTMVLTQRIDSESEAREKAMFPYHYGSHATVRKHQQRWREIQVSIPLWFSRNP